MNDVRIFYAIVVPLWVLAVLYGLAGGLIGAGGVVAGSMFSFALAVAWMGSRQQ